MKKSSIILLFLVLALPLVSGLSMDMKKEYSQGETLISVLSGNFIQPISNDNILFYEGHVRVSIEPHIAKINNLYYIYAILPESSGNYSLIIKDARYTNGTKQVQGDLEFDFTILNTKADFYVDPGVVVTGKDFIVTLQNLVDSSVNINIKTETTYGSSGGFFSSMWGGTEIIDNSENSIILQSGESKKITFKLNNVDRETLKEITFTSGNNTSYTVPVYIFTNQTPINNPIETKKNFVFNPIKINFTMSSNTNKTRPIYLYNTGQGRLENISISISESLRPYLSFSPSEIGVIPENSSVLVALTFSSGSIPTTIKGQITAREKEIYTYADVEVASTGNYVGNDTTDDSLYLTKTCEEIDGKICKLEIEKCSSKEVYAKDGVCCLTSCTGSSPGGIGTTGKMIGWSILIILVLVGLWFFFKKYKSARRNINLLDIAKGKRQ